jgi:ribosome modulation factor
MSAEASYFLSLIRDLRRDVAEAVEQDDDAQRPGAYQRGRDARLQGESEEAAPPVSLPKTRQDWLLGFRDQRDLEKIYPEAFPRR